MESKTGYALLDGQQIAYQVIGDGPVDIVMAPSWFSAFDLEWREPEIRRFFERLASFARVIRFDRRGSGASDPLANDALPPWEAFADDIRCVMETVGAESAFLFGDGDAGPLSVLFAATQPNLVRGLILFHTSARFLADDDYEMGIPEGLANSLADEMTQDWGVASEEMVELWVPSRAADPAFRQWIASLMRATTTPSAVKRYMDGVITADVRDILSSLDLPTLILHPTDSQLLDVENARYLKAHIPASTLVELDGPGDVYPAFALADQIVPEMHAFITGAPQPVRTERALATILFTDIVSSTEIATRVGDDQWRRLLDLHDDTVERDISNHSGKLVKNTGDGILATFDGPGRAIEFASMLRSDLSQVGLAIRTGIHTGEIERRNGDIGGIAVHLGARITAAAGAGEILVSRTVKDLVIGSSIGFEDKGMHILKGIEGEWQLFAVSQ